MAYQLRRPWPHFEYRVLAHGRWDDQRLSIHSIRSNSFNYVKHGRVEYFLYFRARARSGGVDGGQEQRLFKEDWYRFDRQLARNVTSFCESPIL